MKSKKSSAINSKVESVVLQKNNHKLLYSPTDKVSTIIVDNFPALGKLTALRFLEWCQNNEGWTISLPTGKTPEHFIKWVNHLLTNWSEKNTQKLLEESGIDPAKKPDLKNFHFIQILL